MKREAGSWGLLPSSLCAETRPASSGVAGTGSGSRVASSHGGGGPRGLALETRTAFGKRRASKKPFPTTTVCLGVPYPSPKPPLGYNGLGLPCAAPFSAHSIGEGHMGPQPSKNGPWADVATSPDLLQNMTRSCIRIFHSKYDRGQSSG